MSRSLEITPDGIPGLFGLSDSLAEVCRNLGVALPKREEARGSGGSWKSVYDRERRITISRHGLNFLLICQNPDYRMSDGTGQGSTVGDVLPAYRLKKTGFVDSVEAPDGEAARNAVFWLEPREGLVSESRFGIVLERRLLPADSFGSVEELEAWSNADETVLKDEEILGFVYKFESPASGRQEVRQLP